MGGDLRAHDTRSQYGNPVDDEVAHKKRCSAKPTPGRQWVGEANRQDTKSTKN